MCLTEVAQRQTSTSLASWKTVVEEDTVEENLVGVGMLQTSASTMSSTTHCVFPD